MKTLLILLMCLVFGWNTQAAAGRDVTYHVEGTVYEGYFTQPADNAPFILLIHDWDGLTSYEKKRADMLADQGYSVFAADLFGQGVRPTRLEDKRQHTGELYEDRMKMRAILKGALDAAREQGADTDRMVAMGYCFGGAAVLELARADLPMQGYVTFHGGLSTPEGQNYSETQGKVLVFHGRADTVVTMADYRQLRAELKKHDVPHEMIAYDDAPHAFTVFGSERYRQDADEASWQRFLEFLEQTL